MNEFTMSAMSKMAKMLMYMKHTGKVSLWSGDVAMVMACERKQVASLCGPMVRKQYLRMEWHSDGQHYTQVEGLHIQLHAPYLTVSVRPPGQAEAEQSECEDFLMIRRSWVKAEGLPPPLTTAPRSVFELGQAMGVL